MRYRPFPFVFFLIFIGIMLSQPRPGLFLFMILPFVIFFGVLRFFAVITSLIFRGAPRGTLSGSRVIRLEDYWADQLRRDPYAEEMEPEPEAPPRREPPESVQRDPRLLRIWEQNSEFLDDSLCRKPAQSLERQLHATGDLYGNFQKLLAEKLSPEELTYRRFLSAGTQGYELIVAELEQAVSRMRQLRSVGETLRPTADDTGFSRQTVGQIQREQLGKIQQGLTQTQEAVAQFARVNLSISEMRTRSTGSQAKRKEGDISQAIGELKDLAQRARQF